jgi:hypothetical protein
MRVAKKDKGYTHTLKLPKTQGKGVKHGVWALDKLLKGNLDRRYAIVKKRDQLEAAYIDHAGGKGALTPSMISLIKRIIHAELVADQAEKMALLGEFDLTDKSYGALASRQERHIGRLEELIRNNSTKPVMSLETYLQKVEKESGNPKSESR